MPSTKYESENNKFNGIVYLRELDNQTIVDYLRKYPIPFVDDNKIVNIIV